MGRPGAAFSPRPSAAWAEYSSKSLKGGRQVLYQEGSEERVTYELSLEPRWSSLFLPGKWELCEAVRCFAWAQPFVMIQLTWLLQFLNVSSATDTAMSLFQTSTSSPGKGGRVGLEQALGFLPAPNLLVPSTKWMPGSPAGARRSPLPGGGTTNSCFQQRGGLSIC